MICSVCHLDKSEKEFYWKNLEKGIRHTWCIPCSNAYQREWYKNNKESHKKTTSANKAKYNEENFTRLMSYFSEHPCIDCGETDPVVLEFDHRGDKERNISSMLKSLCSWDKILVEISKCDVRCCNCHRRKTAKQFGWRRLTRDASFNAEATGL